VRGAADRYSAAGVAVFGVNGASVRSHRAFARRHRFSARLLSDRGLNVSRAYDALTRWGPFTVINRTVVDRGGRIVFYERGFPSTDAILAGVSVAKREPA
jgi:peroxiredoxin